MAQNKEQIIADMLTNGLLSDEDAERYWADKSVSADEMEEIKRLILLCQKRAESKSKSYSLEEADKMIREKYFSKQSTESTIDDTEYTKQLIQLCDNNQKYIDTGQTRPIEELFNEVEEKYFSEQSGESTINDATYRQQTLKLIEKSEKDFEEGNSISIEDYSGELEERYKNKISENRKEEQEAIEAIIRRGEDDIKNGRLYTEEEFYKEIGLDLSLPPKSKTLKELLSRGDITKEEYEKYMSDDNFSDADAMEMKEIEDIIREGDEDMKNGQYSSFEESWKRILADDDEAIRDCENDIKNGRLYTEEEAIKRIKKE